MTYGEAAFLSETDLRTLYKRADDCVDRYGPRRCGQCATILTLIAQVRLLQRALGAGRTLVGVAVLANIKGQLVVGRRLGSHAAGKFCFPGGHVDPGEGLLDCACREFREETGLELHDPTVIALGTNWMEDAGQQYVTVYVAGDAEGTPCVREPEKCEGWQLVDSGMLPMPFMTPLADLQAMGLDADHRTPDADRLVTPPSLEFCLFKWDLDDGGWV